ncbi:hypothetical protein BX070DRAFT_179110, partial [Coemansia spiralis]
LPDKTTAQIVLALPKVFMLFGFPTTLQSNNGDEFVNKVLECPTHNTGIEHPRNTPYSPVVNGIAGHPVKAVKDVLKRMRVQWLMEWDAHL